MQQLRLMLLFGHSVELPSLGEQLVIFGNMGLAGNMSNQAGLHQLLRRATLGAEEAGLYIRGGYLKLASGIDETTGNPYIGLHFLATLGVRDYHLEAALLQLLNHERPIKGKRAGGQFQQEFAEAVAQLRGSIHPQALQLVITHLEAHG